MNPSQAFADFSWESRWNQGRGPVAGISQSGTDVILFTIMGSARFSLSNPADVASYCWAMRQALELLERTQAEYGHAER